MLFATDRTAAFVRFVGSYFKPLLELSHLMGLLTCLIPGRQFPIALLDRLLRRGQQSAHIYLEGTIYIPQLW